MTSGPSTVQPPAVPVVDLGEAIAGDLQARRRAADQIDDACRSSGFFGVVGHRVPQSLVADCLTSAAALFDLPATTKQQLRVACPPGVQRGYSGLGAEAQANASNGATPPDLSESFAIGPEDPEEVGAFAGANAWPAQPEPLRQVLTTYRAVMTVLARDLLALCALAVHDDEDAFDHLVRHPIGATRLNHYPALVAPPAAGQWRGGPHTDYGTLTVLATDGVSGLEIQGSDGTWWPVDAPAGGFLVNVGDLLAALTQGRWRSTWHRVARPAGQGPIPARTTIAHFQFPDHDARVVGRDADGREFDVLAGDYLIDKLARLVGPPRTQGAVS